MLLRSSSGGRFSACKLSDLSSDRPLLSKDHSRIQKIRILEPIPFLAQLFGLNPQVLGKWDQERDGKKVRRRFGDERREEQETER